RNIEYYASLLKKNGFRVSTKILSMPAESSVPAAAGEFRADLIVLGTHGHRWLSDLLFGSMTSRLRHNLGVPVLLVQKKRA
ncbi:universal stress protein, partial [Candidatus Woesearchaeota archaeon]